MLNKVMLIGNLGKDPEIRYTQSGTAVATFNVATTEQWRDKDGQKQESTEWHRVVVWAKLAETCGEYLHKGSKVMVEGRLKANENGNTQIFTKGDGTVGSTFNLTANQVLFLDNKGTDGEAELW